MVLRRYVGHGTHPPWRDMTPLFLPIAMASNLLAMASNLIAMASTLFLVLLVFDALPFCHSEGSLTPEIIPVGLARISSSKLS